MKKIVGITFNKNDRMTYFFINDIVVKKNDNVIVQTEKGKLYGKVVTDIHEIDHTKLKKQLDKVIKIASKKDFDINSDNIKAEKEALNRCQKLVKKYKLKMNVIDATYTFDKEQLLFHFYADERIDFRELARELAALYHTRIELRQIGVRDRAQKIGGVGVCGQKLCCSRFLKDFDSVSISMAKNQNLALSPSKINGTCGRLLCCLNYENECYKEYRSNLPKIGKKVKENDVEGKVVDVDVLNQKYTIQANDGKKIEVKK